MVTPLRLRSPKNAPMRMRIGLINANLILKLSNAKSQIQRLWCSLSRLLSEKMWNYFV